jgi:CDP-6-deoxy-D-xylo-4-hexulose-3-dehydrase
VGRISSGSIDLIMSNTRDRIKILLSELEAELGVLPKFAHNMQGKSDQLFYSGPLFDHEELSAGIEALITGKWLASGDHVARFERQFCKLINAKHAVMVNSGSSANLVMLGALKAFYDWKDEDEVLVSVVGFPTTVAPIYQHRMRPVFVDIEWETLNFNLEKLVSKITSKTRAVLVSPVLGNPPDMDRLQEICSDHSIRLVLDGCDSLGSCWDGKELSEYAVASSCSFYPAHHITTGEGGMVSSNEQELISITRSIAWWGRDCYCVGAANLLPKGTCGRRFDQWLDDQDVVLDHKYVFAHMGYNLKPLDLQGAIGLEQLKKLGAIHRARRENKRRVEEIFLRHIKGIKIAQQHDKADPSWFGVPFTCSTEDLKRRLVAHLEQNGVQTRNYFAGNLLVHPGYRLLGDWKDYPQANRVLKEVFFVGCSPTFTEQSFEHLSRVVEQFE